MTKRDLTKTPPGQQAEAMRRKEHDEAFAKYGAAIVKLLQRRCRDLHLVEDVAQELWIYVWERFPDGTMSNFKHLKVKALSLLVDEFRKRGVRSFAEPMAEHPEVEEMPAERIFTATHEAQLEEKFWENFPNVNLTAEQKRAFELHKLHGYTLAEIAQMLGRPVSTVGDWMDVVRRECVIAFKKAHP